MFRLFDHFCNKIKMQCTHMGSDVKLKILIWIFLFIQDIENGDNDSAIAPPPAGPRRSNDKAFLARIWGNFDKK